MKTSIKSQAVSLIGVWAAGLLYLTGIHSANAADQPQLLTRTKAVSLGGIDLSTPEGAAEARHRVQQMVRRLCAQLGDDLELSHRETYLECLDRTSAPVQRHLDALIDRAQTIRTAAIK
jgi:UrcA family protein